MNRYRFIIIISLITLFIGTGFSELFASTVKVASIQYRAIPYNKSANIHNLEKLIKEAAVKGAKIIVLPEMCTTGLTINSPEQAKALAETIPGPTTNEIALLAKEFSVYIVLGMPELNLKNNKYYNTQIIIDDQGFLIGKYRKKHLYGSDYAWASVGDLGYQYVETDLGKIGLGICYDINSPDMLDFFSAISIDIFVLSTNWIADDSPFPNWLKAVEGRHFNFIAANNWGQEYDMKFSGGSMILSAKGKILSQTKISTNAIIFASVQLPKKTKNILLTGFEPFGGYSINSSWEAIKYFDKQTIKGYSVKSILLPVEYNKSVIELRKHIISNDPDIIISFGLAPDEYIKLEKLAKNKTSPYPDNIGDVPKNRYILGNMPLIYESRLPLENIYNHLLANDIKTNYSTDAGSYVCNYLFYNLMTFGDNHSMNRIRSSMGFIHLPPISDKFPLEKLRHSVKLIIDVVIDYESDKIRKQLDQL